MPEQLDPKYPVYIVTKGRWQPNQALTVGTLQRDATPFKCVVEPQEVEAYAKLVGEENVLELPFSNLGKGSIPARNWIWQHAKEAGHKRHWCLDDNIMRFRRIWKGQRIPMRASMALRVAETMVDRYSNVGVAGLNYQMFVPPDCRLPHYENVHVYSCSLINHDMPFEWRGRLNEDTDLCLQALNAGWATILTNTVMADKLRTMKLAGGNTDEMYGKDGSAKAEGGVHTDTVGRYEMALALERAWPGIVKIVRKFGRWQHSVNWKLFKDIRLEPAEGVDLNALPDVDEMGMTLKAVQKPESELMQELLETFADEVVDSPTWGHWRGLPGFVMLPKPPKLSVEFPNEAEMEKLIERLGVFVVRRKVQASSAWWPPKRRSDLSSLIYVGADEAEGEFASRVHPNAPEWVTEYSVVAQSKSGNGNGPAPMPAPRTDGLADFDHNFADGPLRRPV